ncbi:TIGR04076 family protein [candidate division KSB1 bacterium]|nr:TIGR04076 family protein [candidate division KSB1 bacterium]
MYFRVRVVDIKGHCPVYKIGDSFKILDGYRLMSEIPLCMHSLAALLPFYNPLRMTDPDKLGLAGKEKRTAAYIQCPDASEYTGGGTAVFEITVDEELQ